MTDNSEILIGGEPINADSIGLDKRLSPKKKKQYMIIGGISILIVILLVIIIIVATTGGTKSNKSEGQGGNDEGKLDPNEALGEIKLSYNFKSFPKPTIILSSNFEKSTNLNIYVKDQFVNYKKEYTFPDKDSAENVKILIFGEIDMNSMFKSVSDLESVQIISTKNLKIKSLESSFEDCTSLSSFTIQGCDTSQVSSVKNLFHNTNIENINIAELNLDNIKDMSYMFADSKLKNIDLSKLNTENVENMAGMFKGSQALSSLDLSNFKTLNVNDMSSMFEGCTSLVAITFSKDNFITNKVTNMSSMFSQCSRINKLDVNFFNTENVVDMSSMFKGCGEINSLDLN